VNRRLAVVLPVLLPVLLAIAACAAPPPTGQARADAATLNACREHADAVYDRQHRDTIYAISSRDSPFSANYTPGLVDRGLSQRFGRETMVRDCVRNTGTEGERSATPTAGTAKP
jgi:hypothetical protein